MAEPPARLALRDRLAAVSDRLTSAASSADRHPAATTEWSVRDVVLHMVAVEEEVWQPRLRQMAGEENPRWAWTEPGPARSGDGQSLAACLVTFAQRRRETVAHLDGLEPSGWQRIGTHAVFGVLDVAGLMREALEHDEEHLADLERRAGVASDLAQS